MNFSRATARDSVENHAIREWKESSRRASSPVPRPNRVGSISSGGVDGFGYLRPETKVNPVKYDVPAGEFAMLDPAHRLLSPGRPWWERDRFKTKFHRESARSEKKAPPSPLPYGSALHVACLAADGKPTAAEDFANKRPDLAGAEAREVQVAMVTRLVAGQAEGEVPPEVGLGPAFAGLTQAQCVGKLLDKLDGEYKGDFNLYYKHLMDDDYATKIRSSVQMRRVTRPEVPYGPPPSHPDTLDGYATARRKHEDTMNRLYGPSSGRVHALPDKPETWHRRDGIKVGVPQIQSFTYYAHELQKAGYGAP